MKTTKKLAACAALILVHAAWAQQTSTAFINGNTDNRQTTTALIGATIHLSNNINLNQATLVIKDGLIAEIRKDGSVPQNTVTINYDGLHIYPGFIHLDAGTGLPEPGKKPPFTWGGKETINSTKKGAYNSNEAINASYDAAKHYTLDKKSNQALRAAGFTAALSHYHDGVMRGTGVLLNLNDAADQHSIITAQASQHFSMDKGSSKQDYPISLMGHVALIRQTLMDADWYPQQNELTDFDLAAINQNRKLPKIISVDNWQQNLLAKKIADEFDFSFTVKTAGDSYKNLKAVKSTGQTLIVPLDFPDAPMINDELDAWGLDYKDLKAWELAPHNPALLAQNQVEFALVPKAGDKGLKSFLKDLRTVHQHGLSETNIIKALTQVPAKILNNPQLGDIKAGYHANLLITDGPLLDKDTSIAQTWIAGEVFDVKGLPAVSNGHYQVRAGEQNFEFKLTSNAGQIKIKAIDDEDSNKYSAKANSEFVSLNIDTGEQKLSLLATIQDQQLMPIGTPAWSIEKLAANTAKPDQSKNKSADLPTIPRPFSAYGLLPAPATPGTVLIKNTTVWTNEDDGILLNTDVLVKNGQIAALGSNLDSKSELEIDGSGMHLTSGIIDEHAHIALLSVNDIAVNSSMVRMEDAINPEDINIYRNLAGGVTAAQLLHGSANPIGGQSALVKLKWGVSEPADMLIPGADGYIKFALGENVKRSRSQDSIRYPLTRMGVEQVFRDAFTQALAYEQAWEAYNKLSKRAQKRTAPPRKDLAMEATLEVLKQRRFVSCHSYVQSEINMLMHVADDFDFKINTFTHILEGYKVADKMHQHGVGASTFSDWWAYKWEVNYAIPYNAALMNNAGVVTAINSDSAEMSRRLNQEAAKSVKYGSLSEQDAWKLVTLNPAKLLHLDDRMGSVKVGKDADLVLWSDNPLSIYAQVEKTMVDGVFYYDRSQQADIENHINKEKQRLIGLAQSSEGKKTAYQSQPPKHFECESITGYHQFDQQLFQGAHQ